MRIGGDAPVLVGGQIVRLDRRRGGGIGGLEPDVSAARRLHVGDARGERRERVQRLAEAIERQRLDMILQVGALARRIGARDDAELRRRHGQRAAAAQRIVEENLGAAEHRRVHLVQRLDARHLVDHPQLQMVLQVLADARLVQHDRNSELRELRGGPDARQQQRLDRSDRARRQDHLAAAARDLDLAVLPIAHADRAPAVELDALDHAAGFEPEVRRGRAPA